MTSAVTTDPAGPAPPAPYATSAAVSQWSLVHRVSDIWDAVLEDCARARSSIDFEQYILTPDRIGARLLGLFAEKARQGVRVRLLCDAFGSGDLWRSDLVADLREAGGQVEFYNRPMLRQLLHLPPRVHRDHRKAVIIDGDLAWIGGACFTDRMADWRDTMMRFRGPLAEEVTGFFETSWARAKAQQTHLEQRRAPPEIVPPDHADGFRYIVNSPERPACRALYDLLREQVEAARHSIRLTTPYYAPEHRFTRDLLRALKRGVSVTVVLPALSDHPPLDVLSHAFAERLTFAGGRVRYYEPAMLHAKLAVVDDRWAAVGSMNLDRLSFRLNLENAVVGHDAAFVEAVAARIEADATDSLPHPPELPHWNRVLDPVLRLAGRIL